MLKIISVSVVLLLSLISTSAFGAKSHYFQSPWQAVEIKDVEGDNLQDRDIIKFLSERTSFCSTQAQPRKDFYESSLANCALKAAQHPTSFVYRIKLMLDADCDGGNKKDSYSYSCEILYIVK